MSAVSPLYIHCTQQWGTEQTALFGNCIDADLGV